MNHTRTARVILTTLLLLAGAFATGCASTATFEGPGPTALAAPLQLPEQRGRWVAHDRYEFNFYTQYVTFQELSDGRTRLEVICQAKEVAPFAFGERLPDVEKAYLASATETILRTTGAKLVKACDKRLLNVQPVATRTLADGDEVLLQGADEQTVLSVLRQGLFSFATLRGSAGGGCADLPHGLMFDFVPGATLMGNYPAGHYLLCCRTDKHGLSLKLSTGPDPKAPNGHDVDMLRSLTAYVLLNVPTARVVAPK